MPQNHDFFILSFLNFFENLMKFLIQNHKKFFYTISMKLKIECAIGLKWIFSVFVALFWGIYGYKWCLSITYLKRETYYLQNATFATKFVSREIIKQKASKTRFFYFTIFEFFWNLMKFFIQNHKKIFYRISIKLKIECAIDRNSIFCVFVALFWGISGEDCSFSIKYS